MIIDLKQKLQKTKDSLNEKATEQNIFNRFLEIYTKEWKELKISYSKFNRSKQFGKTIPLQKPEQQLRKQIRIWLKSQL